MPFLSRGGTIDVSVPVGQSLLVGSFGAGTASVLVQGPMGNIAQVFGPPQYVSGAQTQFGPYTYTLTARVNASPSCDLEYVIGTSPTLSAVPVNYFATVAALTAAQPASACVGARANVAGVSYTRNGASWVVTNTVTHTAGIDARQLPNGSLFATDGTLLPLAGTGASAVSVSSGAIVQPANSTAAYIPLQCDDIVQYMRALSSWPADAPGQIKLVIPAAGGSFPGVGGSGPADAGVHAGIECYYSGAAHTTVLCGGYGPNAGAITGAQTSIDYVSTLPLQGNTRTLELFCNKVTGRVTLALALDSQILVDYFDIRTVSYLSNIGIFEFYPTGLGDGAMPKILAMEISSKYVEPSIGSLAQLGETYLASAFSMTNSMQSTGITVNNGRAPGGCNLVIASVFVSQTSGDTSFRLTDGTLYSANQVVARGAFTGRVTYIEQLKGTPLGDRTITLQAQNSAGVGTLTAGSDTGMQCMVVQGIPLQLN